MSRWIVGSGSPDRLASWDRPTMPPRSAIVSSRSNARAIDCTPPDRRPLAASTSGSAIVSSRVGSKP